MGYILSNGRLIVSDEFGKHEGGIFAYFQVLAQHLPWSTEQNHGKSVSDVMYSFIETIKWAYEWERCKIHTHYFKVLFSLSYLRIPASIRNFAMVVNVLAHLTSRSTVLVETLRVAQLLTKFLAFYGTPRCITVLTRARQVSSVQAFRSRFYAGQYNSSVTTVALNLQWCNVCVILHCGNGCLIWGRTAAVGRRVFAPIVVAAQLKLTERG
jgi:hypothetical protein